MTPLNDKPFIHFSMFGIIPWYSFDPILDPGGKSEALIGPPKIQ